MKLICKNNVTKVYDDGKNYRVVTEDKEDKFISKKDEKAFPLACCLKWDMEAVDVSYLNKLSSELKEQYKEQDKL